MEILRRYFWSTLLIETELGYHIDMPKSNIWKFDDRILLPGMRDTWQPFQDDERQLLSDSPHLAAITPNEAKAYFLAQISMCRMVRRCTTSVTISHDIEVYAPIIAEELAHQVESWYNHLPPSLRFDRGGASPSSAYRPHVVTKFLQMQSFLVLASIYWPAVYGAIYTDTPMIPNDIVLFFEAYSAFITSAAEAIQYCPQALWNIFASIFITTMAALKGATVSSLRAVVSADIIRYFGVAAEMFQTSHTVTVSPSLLILRSVVADGVGGRR